ncbi:MAG: hypothetical protein HYU64_15225 [Armatimonadetes bacterium]|nr:hypothetical protein [Armatimonadota bacterium]
MSGLLDQIIKPVGGTNPPGGASGTNPSTGPPHSPIHPDVLHGLVRPPGSGILQQEPDKAKISDIGKLFLNPQENVLGEIWTAP